MYPFVVDSIVIEGNNTTENFIITRELTFNVGDTLDEVNAYYNRERIYSLGIFNQVYIVPMKMDELNILKIIVEESWYIYPIPFIETKENDFNKLSYGLYLKLKNFRGRNEDVTGVLAFGYDPTFGLNYYNPNIIGKENIFIRFSFGYSDVTNKSNAAEELYGSKFTQKNISAALLFGRRFGLFHRLYSSIIYNYIETPFYIQGINASTDRIDNRIDLALGYEYDTRDLIQFPKNGIYTNFIFTFKGLGIDNINYNAAWFDFREYRNLFDKLIAKWRFATRLTFAEVPYYDKSILGVGEKIRGYQSQKFEGDNFYLTGLEFYYPLIKEFKVDLTFIPIIPDELLSYRVEFYSQIFIETGAAQNRNRLLRISDFESGYGLGFSLLVLPYNILRVDLAFDEYKNTEVIFDLGISF